MNKRLTIVFLVFLTLNPISTMAQQPLFGEPVDLGLINSAEINEASGLVASRITPGVLWTHNDSGDNSRIFALNEQGQLLATCKLVNIDTRDCEDIAVGRGPLDSVSYLYVADIGDNDAQHESSFIYRFPEPGIDLALRDHSLKIRGVETIAFQYPDGSRDAETLLSDPVTGDLFIVSKRDKAARVYRLPFPQPTGQVMTAEYVCTLPFTSAVSGDISAAGDEILIKNYLYVYYWPRLLSQTVGQALAQTPSTIPYQVEPQGEAIAWKQDGSGFFTLSEETFNIEARLYYYPRLPSEVVITPLSPRSTLTLLPNSPNPFNLSTVFTFTVPETIEVTLSIYNELGQRVALLFQQTAVPGVYRVHWQTGALASGLYLCRLQTPAKTLVQKIQLLR